MSLSSPLEPPPREPVSSLAESAASWSEARASAVRAFSMERRASRRALRVDCRILSIDFARGDNKKCEQFCGGLGMSKERGLLHSLFELLTRRQGQRCNLSTFAIGLGFVDGELKVVHLTFETLDGRDDLGFVVGQKRGARAALEPRNLVVGNILAVSLKRGVDRQKIWGYERARARC